MLGQTTNPMLAKVEQGIQSKVKQNRQSALAHIVHDGLSIMYDPETKNVRDAHIAKVTDYATEAGTGAARMISVLYQKSGKTLPLDLVVPAAMIFAYEYLDLVSKMGKVQITPDVIDTATNSVNDNVLPMFGLTPNDMAKLVQQSNQKQSQPQGILSGAQGAA